MPFAVTGDVTGLFDGTPAPTNARVEYYLGAAEARLRLLLPDLEARIADTTNPRRTDLATLAKDVVVQAVLRKLSNTAGPEVRSQSEGVGPWSTTVTFHTDRTRTFSDADLDLLRAVPLHGQANMGAFQLGLTDWHAAGRVGRR